MQLLSRSVDLALQHHNLTCQVWDRGSKEKIFSTRLGNSPDVVQAFEYLLDSPFVTGITLDVNGGAFII